MGESDFDLEYQNQRIESKIVVSLERIAQSFRVLLWQESKKFGLTPIQIQVLIFLLHHSDEKRKVSYLANEFNMTKATISETIRILEQKRLISKEYEAQDTRSYIIHLTDSGKEIAGQVSRFAQPISTSISGLHPDDKTNLLLSLLDIIRDLKESGVITIQRMCMTCSHYQPLENGTQHFCKLLNQELTATDLRIDCPEHESKW
ncbi:MarR family winged helix-turn-helix transcriptional regulator [Niabella terrae]